MLDRRSRRQRESDDPVARYLGQLQAEVMQTMWAKETATVRETLDELNRRRRPKLAYTTVLTLISRLNARGLLHRAPDGRGFRYRPSRSREELLAELSDQLIDRLVNDFGEIGVARLGARLEQLDVRRKEKLGRRRSKP
jgi:predicted transcriptional regulator